MAALYGWRVWHAPTPMRPVGQNRFVPDRRGRGLPDLILMHPDPPRLIFAEVKSETGKVGESQHEFLNLARGVQDYVRSALGETPAALPLSTLSPIQAYIWRPANRDLIEATLSDT